MTTTVPTAALAPSRPLAWTISIGSDEGWSKHRDPTPDPLLERPSVDEVRGCRILAGMPHGLEDGDLPPGLTAWADAGQDLAQLGRHRRIHALQFHAAGRGRGEGMPRLDEQLPSNHGLRIQLRSLLVGPHRGHVGPRVQPLVAQHRGGSVGATADDVGPAYGVLEAAHSASPMIRAGQRLSMLPGPRGNPHLMEVTHLDQ